jgi:hypothetical protein
MHTISIRCRAASLDRKARQHVIHPATYQDHRPEASRKRTAIEQAGAFSESMVHWEWAELLESRLTHEVRSRDCIISTLAGGHASKMETVPIAAYHFNVRDALCCIGCYE